MSTNRTRTRWLTSAGLAAGLLASTVGVAGPASAAPSGTVNVTLHLSISGTYSIPDLNDRLHTYPIDSVLVDVYDRTGRHTDQKCLTEPAGQEATAEQHALTPPAGVTVAVPKGGVLLATPAMDFCYFMTLVEGTVIQKLKPGNRDATVSWHLHP